MFLMQNLLGAIETYRCVLACVLKPNRKIADIVRSRIMSRGAVGNVLVFAVLQRGGTCMRSSSQTRRHRQGSHSTVFVSS